MADIKAIAEELVNLTVKEVNELATVLKDEYGIEPAAAAVAVAAGPAAGGAAAAEEKSSFDVVLAEVGGAKLQVVNAIQDVVSVVGGIVHIEALLVDIVFRQVFRKHQFPLHRGPVFFRLSIGLYQSLMKKRLHLIKKLHQKHIKNSTFPHCLVGIAWRACLQFKHRSQHFQQVISPCAFFAFSNLLFDFWQNLNLQIAHT